MVKPQPPSNLTHAHVLISGRVQGVGFRFHTLSQARSLGVNGWVRNLPGGQVEAVFEGTRDTVERMVHWCHTGSIAAIVTSVEVEYGTVQGFQEFTTRY